MKRAKAKQYYDATASGSLPPLAIGDFVYAKPSPHHKSGPWLYGLVTAVPAPRSYIIETPTGLTRRNRRHLRPAAPPPPEALIPRSWLKQLSTKTPPPAANPPEQTKPVPSPPTLEGSKQSTLAQPTQPSPTDTPSTQMPSSPPNVPQDKFNPLELNTKATVSHPRTGSNTSLPSKEKTVTITRSGRVSKPVARLDLWTDSSPRTHPELNKLWWHYKVITLLKHSSFIFLLLIFSSFFFNSTCHGDIKSQHCWNIFLLFCLY